MSGDEKKDDAAEPNAWLPQAHFGTVGMPLPPLSGDDDSEDPDDEPLPGGTPPDVIMMLGFDPRNWGEADGGEAVVSLDPRATP
jgi:hypothetical protein